MGRLPRLALLAIFVVASCAMGCNSGSSQHHDAGVSDTQTADTQPADAGAGDADARTTDAKPGDVIQTDAPQDTGSNDAADTAADTPADTADTGDTTADTATDAANTGDTTADAGDTSDAPTSCGDVSGLYHGSGTCNNSFVTFPSVICVSQSACNVSVTTVNNGPRMSGTVSGRTLSISTNVPVHQDCSVTPSGSNFDITCHIPTLSTHCSGTVKPVSVPAGMTPCCDVVAQNCPASQRCQPVVIGADVTTACIKTTGNVGLGATCTLGSPSAWNDNCRAGLRCSLWGNSAGKYTCHKLCETSTQCPTGQSCIDAGGTPLTGMCSPMCSPFAAANSSFACPTGLGCYATRALVGARVEVSAQCFAHIYYQAPKGAACNFPSACKTGLMCINKVCTPSCDDSHPCPSGTTCYPFQNTPGLPNGLGVCK